MVPIAADSNNSTNHLLQTQRIKSKPVVTKHNETGSKKKTKKNLLQSRNGKKAAPVDLEKHMEHRGLRLAMTMVAATVAVAQQFICEKFES